VLDIHGDEARSGRGWAFGGRGVGCLGVAGIIGSARELFGAVLRIGVVQESDAVAESGPAAVGVVVVIDAYVDPSRNDGGSEAGEERGADVAGEVLGGVVIGGCDVDGTDAVLIGLDADVPDPAEGADEGFRLGREIGHRHRLSLPAVHVIPPLPVRSATRAGARSWATGTRHHRCGAYSLFEGGSLKVDEVDRRVKSKLLALRQLLAAGAPPEAEGRRTCGRWPRIQIEDPSPILESGPVDTDRLGRNVNRKAAKGR
jgi:hypothetical protein